MRHTPTSPGCWTFLGGEYARMDLTMQLHLGAIRNLNTRRFQALGADVGCDSIGDKPSRRLPGRPAGPPGPPGRPAQDHSLHP